MIISAKLFGILTTGFREDIYSFLYTCRYMYIGKIGHAPWGILNSDQWFQRIFLKISLQQ